MAKENTENDFILRPNLLDIPDGVYQWSKVKPWLKFFKKRHYYGWLTVETIEEPTCK